MSVLGPSFAKQIKSSRGLYRFLKPIADKYSSLAGYRSHGLKYDDILIEENAVVQKVSVHACARAARARAGGAAPEGVGEGARAGEQPSARDGSHDKGDC